MTSYVIFSLMLTGTLAFRTSGKSRSVFHDDLSANFSVDICADDNPNVPDSVRVFDRFENYSLTVGLNNSGYEYTKNNDIIGFGVYPTTISGMVIVQGWDKRTGELVSMELDLTTGNIWPHIQSKITKVVSMCPVNITNTVSKRGIAQTAANLLRGACRSLLSPIAWTNCRTHTTAICTGVSLTLEAAIPIPGDSVIWFWACKGALGLVCGQVGKHDPTSAEVCRAMEKYITDHVGSIIG